MVFSFSHFNFSRNIRLLLFFLDAKGTNQPKGNVNQKGPESRVRISDRVEIKPFATDSNKVIPMDTNQDTEVDPELLEDKYEPELNIDGEIIDTPRPKDHYPSTMDIESGSQHERAFITNRTNDSIDLASIKLAKSKANSSMTDGKQSRKRDARSVLEITPSSIFYVFDHLILQNSKIKNMLIKTR
mgnify:CR=1 FL=1